MKTTKGRKTLYHKYAQEILESIKNKPYHYFLGSERNLCAVFNISRPTLRKALDLLEQQKYIIKIPNKGAFYLGNKLHIDSTINDNGLAFYHVVQSRGLYTHSKVLVQTIETATDDIASKLNISLEENIFHLSRLRYINNELYSLSDSYMPFKFCQALLDVDFTSCSLYQVLEEKANIIPYRLDKTLDIKKANKQEALLLNIAAKEPITIMQTIAYDQKNNPIEYAISKSSAYNTRFTMTSYNTRVEDKI